MAQQQELQMLATNPQALEQKLLQLTVPDNVALKAAYNVLKQFFSNPASVGPIFTLIVNSQNASVRQLAAIYLRKFIAGHWKKVPDQSKAQMKAALLQKLNSEPHRPARLAIAGVICGVGKLTLGRGQWNELLQVLGTMAATTAPPDSREIAMLLFRNLMQTTRRGMKAHLNTMIQVFQAGLTDQNPTVRKESLKSIAATVELITTEQQINQVRAMVTTIVKMVQASLQQKDDETAIIAFEMFTDLAESEQGAAVLMPHFQSLAKFTMGIVGEPKVAIAVRTQAAAYIQWMLRYRSKTVTKLKLVPELLQLSLRCVIEPWPRNADNSDGTPKKMGCDILDEIFLNIAKAQCFGLAMQGVKQLLSSSNDRQQRGALVCLTMMAEGCAFEMKSGNQIPEFLKVIQMGSNSQNLKNREVAMEALQQFVLHFQPEILDQHASIMPLLCGVLNNGQEEQTVKENACNALEVYCEYLGDRIQPYIKGVMGLLSGLVQTNNRKLQSSAVSVIGSVANSAKGAFDGYYQDVAKMLLQMMRLREPEAETLRGEATSCMGCVGLAVGKEKFKPLLPEVIPLVMEAIQSDSSECREKAFHFMQSLTEMMGPDLFLQKAPSAGGQAAPVENLVEPLMFLIVTTLQSSEGLKLHVEDDFGGEGVYQGDDDEEQVLLLADVADDADEEDMRDLKYHVAGGALQEKIAAIHVLSKMCEHCGKPMLQYIEQVMVNSIHAFEYPHPSVRAAITRCFCQATMLIMNQFSSPAWTQGQAAPLNPNVTKWLLDVLPMNLNQIHHEDDMDTVAEALDCLCELIRKAGPGILMLKMEATSPRTLLDEIVGALMMLLKEKTACQNAAEEDVDVDGEENDLLAETTDLIGAIAEVMGPAFEPHFAQMADILFGRLQDQRRHFHDRSMAIGCVGDVAQYLQGGCMNKYLDKTLTTAIALANKKEDTQLTQNSVFAMGAMISSCGAAAAPYLDRCVQTTSQFLSIERSASKEENFVRDNAVSMIGKVYMTNPAHPATQQCIPAFLKGLPLAIDFAENKFVLQALIKMLQTHFQQLQGQLPHIMTQLGRAFISADVKDETKKGLLGPVKQLLQNQAVRNSLAGVPEEVKQSLQKVMAS